MKIHISFCFLGCIAAQQLTCPLRIGLSKQAQQPTAPVALHSTLAPHGPWAMAAGEAAARPCMRARGRPRGAAQASGTGPVTASRAPYRRLVRSAGRGVAGRRRGTANPHKWRRCYASLRRSPSPCLCSGAGCRRRGRGPPPPRPGAKQDMNQ